MGTIIGPILHMKQLRSREIRKFSQDNTAWGWNVRILIQFVYFQGLLT